MTFVPTNKAQSETMKAAGKRLSYGFIILVSITAVVFEFYVLPELHVVSNSKPLSRDLRQHCHSSMMENLPGCRYFTNITADMIKYDIFNYDSKTHIKDNGEEIAGKGK